jgi:DNA polymerase III subunit delta'
MPDLPDTVDAGDLWGEVIGQDAAVAVLRTAVARGEVAHAWLLCGPAGVGQTEIVAALAADLNCLRNRSEGDTACGTCTACERIGRDAHPALQTLSPEGSEHVVGAVRGEWIPAATHSLVEGRTKVLHVVAAERMNEAAQNAFLKVLEEPPGDVVWVLEAEDDTDLLDTIVSRCRRLDLAPWGAEHLRRYAQRWGVLEPHVEATVNAAMGSPDRLELLTRPGVTGARDRHLRIVGRLVDEGPVIAVPVAKELTAWAKERAKALKDEQQEELERLEEAYGGEWPPGIRNRVTKRHERAQREERRRALRFALDDIASYLRDLLATHGGGGIVNLDHAASVERDAERVPPAAAIEGLTAVRAAADALERQGQPELHIERLLLRLGVAIYRATA